jgi:hypothetical protein
MIDPKCAWQLLRVNALKAYTVNLIWHSIVQEKQYQILQVLNGRLIIKRQDSHQSQELTEKRIINAIKEFNSRDCKVKRRHLISPTVAEETALVLFHPNLTGDENGEYIIENF